MLHGLKLNLCIWQILEQTFCLFSHVFTFSLQPFSFFLRLDSGGIDTSHEVPWSPLATLILLYVRCWWVTRSQAALPWIPQSIWTVPTATTVWSAWTLTMWVPYLMSFRLLLSVHRNTVNRLTSLLRRGWIDVLSRCSKRTEVHHAVTAAPIFTANKRSSVRLFSGHTMWCSGAPKDYYITTARKWEVSCSKSLLHLLRGFHNVTDTF